MYLEYDYYSNTYQGKVEESRFVVLELQAAAVLNYYTFNRIEKVDDNIRLAMCELIDFLDKEQESEGKEIESESVGGYSVKFQKKSVYSKSRERKSILNKYLGHTDLLYRGG